MKACKSFAIAALIAAATLIVSTPVVAQGESLKVAVPFDFYVSGKLMPAGTYIVSQLGAGNTALKITDSSGKSVYVMTGALKKKPNGATNQLVFRRYGETTFLAGIYWTESSEGREVPATRVEERLAQAARAPNALAVNAR